MKHEDYTVGWICALPVDKAAAVGMLDERHGSLPSRPQDNNIYNFGRLGDHNVVIASLPAGVTGTVPAAKVATHMLSTFTELRFGLMVGIGGGVPSDEHDIRLGDVVVSKPTGTFGGVIQYDFGKTIQEGKFFRTGSLNKPPELLLHAVADLEAKHMMEKNDVEENLSDMIEKHPAMKNQFTSPGAEYDSLYEADYDHPEGNTSCSQCDAGKLVTRKPRSSGDLVIHYGLIASGNQLMRHGGTRDRLRKELDIICFEMNAAGLMDSFPCLVIRGICNYADSHKNKRWQEYAAATASAYARELLSLIPRTMVISTQAAIKVTTAAGGLGSQALNENNEAQQCLTALFLTDPRDDREKLIDIKGLRTNGAWERIKTDEPCNSWLNSRSQLLWFSSDPGKGKTMLSISLAEELEQRAKGSQDAIFMQYSCNNKDERRNTAVAITRGLIFQLLQLRPELFKCILRSFKIQRESLSTNSSFEALWRIFETMIRDPGLGAVYCVLDGLDECDEALLEILLKKFKALF